MGATPLKHLRESAGVKVAVAAYQLHTSRKTLWQWESGRARMPENRLSSMAILYQVPLQTVVWCWLEMRGVKNDAD